MIRWKIVTDNRVGMVHDVLRIFSEEEISIISMEVIPEQIHIKIEEINFEIVKKLWNRLYSIPGVSEICDVEVLPYEEREQQLRTVLNSVSEGIIAVNLDGMIKTINPAAEKIILRSSEELLNKPIQEVLGEKTPISLSLKKGKNYDNLEIRVKTPQGRTHYLTSGCPIRDEQENIIGAVAVLKDIDQVRQLVYKVTQPSMITFEDIIYQSKEMDQVVKLAQKIALTNSTVLIRGESGTGKEFFARSIHMASMRVDKPFLPINCGALPDSLLESELFGYEEGTFTGGSKGGKQGLFELAQGGTLFLDEIGELPTKLQVKLLRVLQEGKVRRVGGFNEQPIDVRIIAATNKNLEKMIEHSEFREDLYYRLNVIPIHIPPLRMRKEDINILVEHFLKTFVGELLEIDEMAWKGLIAYDWPGNVRELRNVIERAVHLTNHDKIYWSDLFPEHPEIFLKSESVEIKIHQISSFEEVVGIAERALLKKVLKEYHSSRQMAKVLGVSHTTVINKLKKHELL
ncbi:MAG: sigma 54-interacting transcriptional regulator [Halanaerobiales bacterium]|nr:sigma 54-interacting transcriptional regulator [Halanaerobiales bacterium]